MTRSAPRLVASARSSGAFPSSIGRGRPRKYAGALWHLIDVERKAKHLDQARQTIALLARQPLSGGFAPSFQRLLGDQAEFEARIARRHTVGQMVERRHGQPALDLGGQR